MTEVRVEVRGAVRELFKSDDPLVCVSGPAGTGKSYGALLFLHLTLLKHPGTRALLLRKTHTSLTSTTLVTFKGEGRTRSCRSRHPALVRRVW